MKGGYMNRSLTDEWGTPISLYVGMCKEFDVMPELDVCATEKNTKCEKFYDKNIDGLTQEWSCDFFMNPPFSKAKFWIKKAFEEHRKFNVKGFFEVKFSIGDV